MSLKWINQKVLELKRSNKAVEKKTWRKVLGRKAGLKFSNYLSSG